jgi:hypothetical protein
MAPDCYRIAGAALAMSTSSPRELSAAHFARIADGPTLRAALAALPFVARGIHSEPGFWHDEQEAAAVLTEAIFVHGGG